MAGASASSAPAAQRAAAAAAAAGPEGHDVRYDQVVKETQESTFSWLFGGKPKSQSELRDERYCGYLVSMDKVLSDWQRNELDKTEALRHAEYYMEKIVGLGTVDAERARELLSARGIDDQKRMDLQREFQDLKRACNQHVPLFDGQGRHLQDRTCKDMACC
mmetsp:Transcript_6639/g.16534  ORF Transcript_6639/g.16534 Transcript_6639/m.16534 type:complete len:162 (+) Transcript_6639:97-582(+)